MALDGGGSAFNAGTAIALTLATIGGAIALSAVRSRKKSIAPSIMGLDQNGDVVIPEQPFQWWPENISDTIGIGWNFKSIPGASHALAQWGANDGRTISMELVLSRNMRYAKDFADAGFAGDVPLQAKLIDPDGARSLAFNVDIRRMVAYLRAYCYPDYDASDGGIALPPVTALLNIPGLQLNESGGTDDGGDVIAAVMTACDVNYKKGFGDGKPRLASVTLSFKQIVQTPDGVFYHTRNTLLERASSAPFVGGLQQVDTPVSVARELNTTKPEFPVVAAS